LSDKTCSNIHEGHRKRLRESYIKSNGSDALRDHQLLELLLFYAIPRRDVNPLAHRLVNRFGSLRGVLEASFSELAEEGVSQSTAILIKLVGDINFRAKIADAAGKQLKNTDDAMDFCSALIAEEREEVCLAVCLNAKSAVTYSEIVGRGNSSETPFSLRRIVEIALAQKSNAIIIAHNHPSGDPKPSALDIENTRRLRLLLNEVGIDMQEHIIVCSSACYAIVRGYSRSTEHFGSTSDTAQKTCTEDKPVRITVSNSGA
jgi:DNA repair protein RadC